MAFRRPFYNDAPYFRSDMSGSPSFRNDSFPMRTGLGPSALDINRGPYLGPSAYTDPKLPGDSKYSSSYNSYGTIRKDPPMYSGYEGNNRPMFSTGSGSYPEGPGMYMEEPSNKRFKQNFSPNVPRGGQFISKTVQPVARSTPAKAPVATAPKTPVDKPKPPPPTPEKLAALEKSGVLPMLDATGNAFHCYYCDAFCNSMITAECHIESPKHKKHMTEPNEKLQGIDAKFTMKTDKITDVPILRARKEELKKLTEEQKTGYVEQMIRLKNGVGGEAYFCLLCISPLNSAKVVDSHIASSRHISNYEAHKLEVEAEPKEDETKKDKVDSLAEKVTLEEQLKLVKVPVIGLEEVIEYIDPENEEMRLYECTLCKVFTNAAAVVNHIVGFKHRANYIKKVRPLEAWSFGERTRDTMNLAQSKAKEIEDAEGRKKWTVKNEKAKVPPNISVSPTKKVHPKEITEPVNSIETSSKSNNILDMVSSFKVDNDQDAQKAVEVVNSLVDALLKYKLNKFPSDLKVVLAAKLLNEGIKTTFPENLANGTAELNKANSSVNSNQNSEITIE